MSDLSFVLPLRDAEPFVARLVRQAAAVGRRLEEVRDGPAAGPRFEILALDERSGDNTLALLSLLHGQIPELRTVQGIAPGRAIARGVRLAKGRVVVLADHPTDEELLRWAAGQVARGHRAALVPGEVLALGRDEAATYLTDLRGGLVAAQERVRRALRHAPGTLAFSPPPAGTVAARARLRARKVAARLGLGRLDRPGKGAA